MKPNQSGMLSPYRQFGCFYEKNIGKYRASFKTLSFHCGDARGTSAHPLYQIQQTFTCKVPPAEHVKFEEPTWEEYCEWYFKKYGIPKELKERAPI